MRAEDDADAGLGGTGLKSTQPRRRVLAVLHAAGERHHTAEGLFRMPLAEEREVPLATVHRVLAQLERAGIVRRSRIGDGGQAVYELDDGAHHDHLVCVRCERVAEFADEAIERRQRAVAAARGFDPMDHRLVLFGVRGRDDCSDASRMSAGERRPA